jgi:class 3 adenylate cyclase
MQNPIKLFTVLSQKIGASQIRSKDDELYRQMLVMISILIGIAGVVWGIMYLILGQTLSAIFPFAYSLLIGVSIILFHFRKRYSHFLFTQLFLTLFTPFLLQWSLGGFSSSGAVVIWAFLAPMGSLMFQGIRKSIGWFIAYMVLVILLAYFDQILAEQDQSISEESRLLFFGMNITAVSAITFSTIMYFINEQIKQKALNLELLEISKKDKLKIEEQHTHLSANHIALQEEQDKTQNMLHKIETLFGQQVSEAVVQELVTQKKDFKGKSYNVTILFLDIRDFTHFADSKPPEKVASFQNIVFSELIEIVRKNNGITNQILGDGIMAVFGAPVESNSHIVDAVASGYSIIGKVNELFEKNRIPQIRVGIGLHCGRVIAGNIGSNYRKQYSLTGSTVIIASRIEQLNKVYKSQFLVSEEVYKEIRNSGHPITELGEVELKGIKQAVGIYQLV